MVYVICASSITLGTTQKVGRDLMNNNVRATAGEGWGGRSTRLNTKANRHGSNRYTARLQPVRSSANHKLIRTVGFSGE